MQAALSMKAGIGAIWILRSQDGVLQNSKASAAFVVIVLQLALLIAAVIMTEVFIGRQKYWAQTRVQA